jgi:outer membrane PBP1 activator LpoA protein
MQKACVISSNTKLNQLITNTFNEEWLAIGGKVNTINTASDAKSIEVQLNENLCDMIFLAAEPESARKVRALLPSNMPTFGTSEVYTGIAFNADDAALKGMRFVDIPWIVDRENPNFNAYKQAAIDLPAGQMQRWFALGADAYQILIALDSLNSAGATIDGLSGKIEINAAGEISRTLANASFGAEGVVLQSGQ